ncbi:MAG TPA: ABC transporter permease subunit, partial [Kribbella sp.]|nr:ABC transporter permease subunit [Kribbella sp.]
MDIWSTLGDTFLDWESMKAVLPEMLKVGLVNTLILAAASVVLGTVLGMVVAVLALSAKPWLRWPAKIYTDIFRGLPAILT